MEAKLIVIGGKANKSEVKLKLPTTIGRSRKADLTVAHPKVSRHHCELFERDGLLVVRDTGSLNGTFIGETRVTEAILKPGDKLTVGPLTFVAVYEHEGQLPPPMPDPTDVPTPAVEPVNIPAASGSIGRNPGVSIPAAPVDAADEPEPLEFPIDDEEEAALPEPSVTTSAEAPAAEAESDDFNWLTGDTVSTPEANLPEPGEVSTPAEEVGETATLEQPESVAEELLSEPAEEALPEPAAETTDQSVAPAAEPASDGPDFRFLTGDSEEPPEPFDAQQPQESAAEVPAEVPVPPTAATPEPPIVLPEPAESSAEAAQESAEEVDNFDWLKQADSEPETPELAFPSDTPAEAAEASEEETLMFVPDSGPATPNFEPAASPQDQNGAMDASGEDSTDEEAGFPNIALDASAAPSAAQPKPKAPAVNKSAGKKSWWPFGGKKKGAARHEDVKASAPAPSELAEPIAEEAAEDASPAEAESAPPEDVSFAPAAASESPPFIPPEPAPAAEESSANEASANGAAEGDDEALSDFFKSLK